MNIYFKNCSQSQGLEPGPGARVDPDLFRHMASLWGHSVLTRLHHKTSLILVYPMSKSMLNMYNETPSLKIDLIYNANVYNVDRCTIRFSLSQ